MQANGIASAVLFSCLLIAASVWDIRRRIIPDTICVAIAAVGMLTFYPAKLLGGLLALPFLVAALVKEGGMGGGDVKLVATSGFVLGFHAGNVGLVVGLLAALIWNIVANVAGRLKRGGKMSAKESSLPLAPFLSFGFAVAYAIQ